MTQLKVREKPYDISMFEITPSGECVETLTREGEASVYIDIEQVHKLWDIRVAKEILNRYGSHVAVMHGGFINPIHRTANTRQYALGR